MDRDMHEGKWTKKVGAQLEGKTVVVIGLGRIGRKVVSLLKPFNVRLIAVDPDVREEIDGVEILPLDKALTEADIITIHSSGEQQYNTPPKLDRGIRWTIACHNSKEGRQDGQKEEGT